MKPSCTSRWLVVLPTLLAGASVLADENHYNNMVIGDRAMGLAGAYTAVSDDPSGLFYNPAGIVYAGKRNLSASVNALNFSSIRYEEVVGGEDWVRDSTTFRPNFFGVVQPFGKGTVGFSYAVTDAILEDQDSRFVLNGTNIESFSINFNNEDTTIEVGPSYARELSEDLSIGLTLYFHVRERETINNSFIRAANGEFEWLNSYFQTSEYGITPVLGLMWSPLDKVSFGLSLRRTTLLTTESQIQDTCASDITSNANTLCLPDATTGNAQDPQISEPDQERDLPLNIVLGLAWFPNDALMVSGDLSYYGETSDYTGDRESLVNLAAGVEYYLNDQWALRGGFFTNFANTPSINPGDTNSLSHIDYYGFTTSLSRFTRNSSITAGLSLAFGDGEAQLLPNSTAIQDVSGFGGSIFLSTSYTY